MTWVSSHAADASHRRVLLLEWTVGGSTYRWAAWDVPVVTSGSTGAAAARWTPFGFAVSGISSRQGELAGEATIEIQNADGVVSAIILAAGGCAGTAIAAWEAWLDPAGETMVSQQEQLILSGLVNAPTITPESVEVTTSPPAALEQIPIPRRLYSTNGTAVFKSSLCGYVGAGTSCDRTYSACTAFSNQARFCGFYRLDPRN